MKLNKQARKLGGKRNLPEAESTRKEMDRFSGSVSPLRVTGVLELRRHVLCDNPKHHNNRLGQIHRQADDLCMRLICDERNRLSKAYDEALRDYARTVAVVTDSPHEKALWEQSEQARKAVETCRGAMRKHCLEHGCDPGCIA